MNDDKILQQFGCKRLIYDVFKNTHLAANLPLVINAGDKTNDSTSKTLCQTISRTMAAHY